MGRRFRTRGMVGRWARRHRAYALVAVPILVVPFVGAGIRLHSGLRPTNSPPVAVTSPVPSPLLALPSPSPIDLPSPSLTTLPSPTALPVVLPSPSLRLPVPTARPSLRPSTPPATPSVLPLLDPWLDFREGSTRSGYSAADTHINPASVGTLRLSATHARNDGTPIVVNDDVVALTTGEDGTPDVAAFPARGCAVSACTAVWTVPFGPPQNPPSPRPDLSSDGRTIFINVNIHNEGWLYALSASGCGAATCAPLWSSQFGYNTAPAGAAYTLGAAVSGPLVDGGFVFTAAFDNGGLDVYRASGCGASTCQPLWTGMMPDNHGASSAPIASGGLLFVASDGGIVAFREAGCGTATCTPVWSLNLGTSTLGTPAVADGHVYMTSIDGRLLCIDAAHGALLWSTQVVHVSNGQYDRGSPMAGNGLVVVGADSGVEVRDGATAALLWTAQVPTPAGNVDPTGAGGVFFAYANNDTLYAFSVAGCSAASCPPLWSSPVGPAQQAFSGGEGPIVAGDYVFLGAWAQLFCFTLR